MASGSMKCAWALQLHGQTKALHNIDISGKNDFLFLISFSPVPARNERMDTMQREGGTCQWVSVCCGSFFSLLDIVGKY